VDQEGLKLYLCNVCKATSVTHTKRIYRNLLRKETSFVCYTSSVLIQIENYTYDVTHKKLKTPKCFRLEDLVSLLRV